MQYDRVATSARIFDAASAAFARDGIDGARIDRIASDADSSKALIYAYFGNKDALFARVVTAKLTQFAESVTLDPADVTDYFTSVFDFLIAHPDVIRLMQHEALHYERGDVPGFATRRDRYRDRIVAIKEAQAAGTVDPNLDPEATYLQLMGMVNWYFAAPQIVEMLMAGEGTADAARFRASLEHVVRKLLAP